MRWDIGLEDARAQGHRQGRRERGGAERGANPFPIPGERLAGIARHAAWEDGRRKGASWDKPQTI